MVQQAPVGWIREVVLDAPDPWALARFWAGLLGGTPVEWYPGWVTLEPPPHGQRLSFQRTGTPLAGDTARVHVDVLVEDLAAAHGRVIAAGATPSVSSPADVTEAPISRKPHLCPSECHGLAIVSNSQANRAPRDPSRREVTRHEHRDCSRQRE